jgi:hypothetical protein
MIREVVGNMAGRGHSGHDQQLADLPYYSRSGPSSPQNSQSQPVTPSKCGTMRLRPCHHRRSRLQIQNRDWADMNLLLETKDKVSALRWPTTWTHGEPHIHTRGRTV